MRISDGSVTARVGYRDTYAWMLVKHVAQLGVIGAAITFVLEAGNSPMISLIYAAVSLAFLALVTLFDRQRYEGSANAHERTATLEVPGYARTWSVAAPANELAPQLAQPMARATQPAIMVPAPQPVQQRPVVVPTVPNAQLPTLALDMAAILHAPVSVT